MLPPLPNFFGKALHLMMSSIPMRSSQTEFQIIFPIGYLNLAHWNNKIKSIVDENKDS